MAAVQPAPLQSSRRICPISEDFRRLKSSSEETRKHWGTFCRSTSIHGMRYLAEPSKSYADKLWWALVVIIGFFVASHYVGRQWVKFTQTAINADNEERKDHISLLPFPAFTICDNRKLKFALNETTSSDAKNYLYLTCGDDRLGSFNYMHDQFIDVSPPAYVSCEIERVVPEIMDHWLSQCTSLMTRTLTDQGVCYTFNMLTPDEIFRSGVEHGHSFHSRKSNWSMVEGYVEGAPMFDKNFTDSLNTGPYPKRGYNAYYIRLFHNDWDNSSTEYCYSNTDGYKIILHNPDELPMVGNRLNPWVPLKKKTKDKYFDFPAHKAVLLDFKVRKLIPAADLDQYSLAQRKCYLPQEKELAYFRIYNYNNCQQECLTNLTENECGCIDYYMPRIVIPGKSENVTKICASHDELACVLVAFDLWDRRKDMCSCLPTCTTMEYDVVTWYSNRDEVLQKAEGKYEGMLVTDLTVYSTDDKYITSERRPDYTRVDFISDCGGVFGLFCGMSIISIVEFMYYSFLWIIGRREKTKP